MDKLMLIWLQVKNFSKLLLIGAVLFIITLAMPASITKGTPSKSNAVCQDENAQKIYLEASKQTRLESPDLLLMDGTCVKASAPSLVVTPKVLGTITGGDDEVYYEENMKMEESQRAIVEYLVKDNDTLAAVAEKFGISLESVLWANNLTKSSTIKPGQKLVIPPVSGVIPLVLNTSRL